MPNREYSTYSEKDLVTFLKQRDKDVFDYLYNNYSAAIFGVINKIVKDFHTSEDVLQDVFVKIWARIDQYDPSRGSLFTWMMNIANNASLDTLRSKGNIMKQKCDTECNDHLVNTATGKRTDTIGLSGLLLKLKPDHQAIMKMVYYQGYTTLEVAQMLDIPSSTIKTRVRRSLTLLRQCYSC